MHVHMDVEEKAEDGVGVEKEKEAGEISEGRRGAVGAKAGGKRKAEEMEAQDETKGDSS
ncbi:hypothetical protein HK102_010023, partial [Quaeritorhiza haematococci]